MPSFSLACTDDVRDISLAMGNVSVFCVLRRGRDKQLEANDPMFPLHVGVDDKAHS